MTREELLDDVVERAHSLLGSLAQSDNPECWLLEKGDATWLRDALDALAVFDATPETRPAHAVRFDLRGAVAAHDARADTPSREPCGRCGGTYVCRDAVTGAVLRPCPDCTAAETRET